MFFLLLFCHALSQRSIGKHQPFQLYVPEMGYEFVEYAQGRGVSVIMDQDGWIRIDNNPCETHACLMFLFKCHETSAMLDA